MKSITFLCIACLISCGYSKCKPKDSNKLSVTESTSGRAKPCELIFNEDFLNFNLETWSHEITALGGGNGEFQMYINNRSNSFVRDGKLHIKPTLTAERYGENFLSTGTIDLNDGAPSTRCTNAQNSGCFRQGSEYSIIPPITSARIRTINSFSFKYGIVKVRAKLPLGDWLWPAIWLLPTSSSYGGWPVSGEIDILESRGNRKLRHANGNEIGVEQIASTLHYGPYFPLNGFQKAHKSANSPPDKGFDKNFHDYEMDWTPTYIHFKLDGKTFHKVEPPANGGFWELGGFDKIKIDNPWSAATNPRMAPFDQKFHLVINLAVGGTGGYFTDDITGNTRKPWENRLGAEAAAISFWNRKNEWYPTWNSSALIIESVKVYASEYTEDKSPTSRNLKNSASSPNADLFAIFVVVSYVTFIFTRTAAKC